MGVIIDTSTASITTGALNDKSIDLFRVEIAA